MGKFGIFHANQTYKCFNSHRIKDEVGPVKLV